MLKVSSNPQKNVLYITVAGHFDAKAIETCFITIFEEARKLRPGFSIINDMRQCHPTDAEGVDELKRSMAQLREMGAGQVVRVTQLAISARQIERASQGLGFEPIQVYSVEEAERILATRLNHPQSNSAPTRDFVRKYRRISTGPEHTVGFTLAGQEFQSVRIANLSAQGCFALLQRHWGTLLYEGAILFDFFLQHEDLPKTKISAKVVRYVKNLTEISEDDIGLGIMFLSPSPRFLEWVDAYVSAYFDADA